MLDKRSEEKGICVIRGCATYMTTMEAAETGCYRWFRIVQTGKNSSFNYRLHITGLELYGVLISDMYGNFTAPPVNNSVTQDTQDAMDPATSPMSPGITGDSADADPIKL